MEEDDVKKVIYPKENLLRIRNVKLMRKNMNSGKGY